MIRAERSTYSVAVMCRCLKVSRSGYYAWVRSPQSERAQRDEELVRLIVDVHEQSRGTYGSPRVHKELQARGHVVGHKRVERLMREEGVVGRCPRRRPTTTVRDDSEAAADNVLNREFSTDAPDKVWVGDITYIATREGWLYLAVLIDLYSRRVVGWSMADHLRTELPMGALKMALGHRDVTAGPLHHSDRGCQYTSRAYQAELRRHGLGCSMSRAGNCHDNAVAESFFGTLKNELFYEQAVPETRDGARARIHEYIECFYNRERRHSAIGYSCPVEFEALYHERVAATVAA